MIDSRPLTRMIPVLMAMAVLVCLLAVAFSDQLSETMGEEGVSLAYVDELFDTDTTIRVDIRVSEEDWADMLCHAESEQYYPCEVSVNGSLFYSVGIRPKGNTTLLGVTEHPDSDRYSFKLEFDHYVDHQTCFGLDKLVLNNGFADATNMKEAVIYDMYAFLGADAPLYNYAEISVNGAYFGTYLALEAVEDSFLLRNYGTAAGELYQPECMLFHDNSENVSTLGADLNYTDDNPDSYTAIWDGAVSSVSSSDKTRVITALRHISRGEHPERYLDTDNILKYMAVHTFAVNVDSLSGVMPHNYYLYEENGVLNLLPWDYNLAFGRLQGGNSTAEAVIHDAIDSPFPMTSFFDCLLEEEQYRAQYHAYLRQLCEEYVGGGTFDAAYHRIRSQIDPLVNTDPTAFYSPSQYDAAAKMLCTVMSRRSESILGQLDGTIPATDAAQKENPSALFSAPEIDVTVMGTMRHENGVIARPDFMRPQEDETQDIPVTQPKENAVIYGICLGLMIAALFVLHFFRRKPYLKQKAGG